MAKSDDLLEDLRNLTTPFVDGNVNDPLHKIARAFVALDMEILGNRPPDGWSLSKFSKSNFSSAEIEAIQETIESNEEYDDDKPWDGTGAW